MRLLIVLSLAGVMALACSPRAARAELLIGLTTQNSLISFDSATPGTVASIGAVTGVAAGDTLVGIDRRPSQGANNGRIYSLGMNLSNGTARIYTLNESTGAATLVSTLAADPADVTAPTPFTTVAGTTFGVDFNPVPDRLRVTGNTGQNLRINVDNGLTQLDVPLAYEAGDPNFGEAPVDVAVAYSNNFGGAPTTVLRGVDIGQSPDALVVHTIPNGGTLMTSLNLPFDAVLAAYDISGLTGTPYFAVAGTGPSQLYSGTSLVGTIGGGVPLVGLAAQVGAPVPEPGTLAMFGFGLAAWGCRAWRRKRAA